MIHLSICTTKEQMAAVAAKKASEVLRSAIAHNGYATFIAATGTSQRLFLKALTVDTAIAWNRTRMFHLDEYVGLSSQHPASFRRYLDERIVQKVRPGEVYFVEGDAPDPQAEAARLGQIISRHTIDVAFIGVGENAHIAFNDPPADFETTEPYLVVSLDKACRGQQVGEGWFATIDDVPKQAITMSVNQIMKSKTILCTVPDLRKAQAVRDSFGGEGISPMFPASILKTHPSAYVYLDHESASLLRPEL